jgi:hypothetical protein
VLSNHEEVSEVFDREPSCIAAGAVLTEGRLDHLSFFLLWREVICTSCQEKFLGKHEHVISPFFRRQIHKKYNIIITMADLLAKKKQIKIEYVVIHRL